MYEIIPNTGIGPVLFGQSLQDTIIHLGKPIRRSERGKKLDFTFENDFKVRYVDDRVTLVSVGRRAVGVVFDGLDVMDSPPRAILEKILAEAEAWELMGMLFFPKYDMMLSGFHDGDEGQKAVVMESLADWPAGFEDAKPYVLPKGDSR